MCHDISKQRRQVVCQRDPNIDIQTLEEEVNTLEQTDDRVVTCRNVSYSLKSGVMPVREDELGLGKRLTPSRTPMPVKMVFAGVRERQYGTNEATHQSDPFSKVSENIYRMWTVRSNQAINFSSALRNLLKFCA